MSDTCTDCLLPHVAGCSPRVRSPAAVTWVDLGKRSDLQIPPRVGGGLPRLCTAQSRVSRAVGTADAGGGAGMDQTGQREGERAFAVHVFGHTTVRTPDRILRASDFTGVKPRQILELIALGRGEPMRKAAIAEHIWSGRPPRRWQVTLESYVALLRRAMQPGVPGRATVLCTTPGGYRLDTERVGIDLHDFDGLTRRAAHAAPHDALPLWERAVEIADATLLATEPYAAWAVDARRTHERAAAHGCGHGRGDRARAAGRRARGSPGPARDRARPAVRARLAAAHPRGARRRPPRGGRPRLPLLPRQPPPRPRPRTGRADPRAVGRCARRLVHRLGLGSPGPESAFRSRGVA